MTRTDRLSLIQRQAIASLIFTGAAELLSSPSRQTAVLLRGEQRRWFGASQERVFNPLACRATLLRHAFGRS